MITPQELLAFEQDIAEEFAAGNIHAAIHLNGGPEEQLIKLFRQIDRDDWVLCGWRSHYHCLLRGVPPGQLKADILRGRSVSLCYPDHKIFCSGIMGGIAPIAVGLAWAAKKKNDEDHTGQQQHVYCFVGDMTWESGIVAESVKYAARHDLPVRWVVENNGLSVMTDTQRSWGDRSNTPDVYYYSYKLARPHAGVGPWVRF